jgi:hypothetical protein
MPGPQDRRYVCQPCSPRRLSRHHDHVVSARWQPAMGNSRWCRFEPWVMRSRCQRSAVQFHLDESARRPTRSPGPLLLVPDSCAEDRLHWFPAVEPEPRARRESVYEGCEAHRRILQDRFRSREIHRQVLARPIAEPELSPHGLALTRGFPPLEACSLQNVLRSPPTSTNDFTTDRMNLITPAIGRHHPSVVKTGRFPTLARPRRSILR